MNFYKSAISFIICWLNWQDVEPQLFFIWVSKIWDLRVDPRTICTKLFWIWPVVFDKKIFVKFFVLVAMAINQNSALNDFRWTPLKVDHPWIIPVTFYDYPQCGLRDVLLSSHNIDFGGEISKLFTDDGWQTTYDGWWTMEDGHHRITVADLEPMARCANHLKYTSGDAILQEILLSFSLCTICYYFWLDSCQRKASLSSVFAIA